MTVQSATDNSKFGIESQDYKLTSDQYVISLDKELEPGQSYQLFISFRKISLIDLSDHGFIRFGYKKEAAKDMKSVFFTP